MSKQQATFYTMIYAVSFLLFFVGILAILASAVVIRFYGGDPVLTSLWALGGGSSILAGLETFQSIRPLIFPQQTQEAVKARAMAEAYREILANIQRKE